MLPLTQSLAGGSGSSLNDPSCWEQRKNPRPPVKKGFKGRPSDGDSGEGASAEERIRANQRLKRSLNQGLGKHRMGQAGCPQGELILSLTPTVLDARPAAAEPCKIQVKNLAC